MCGSAGLVHADYRMNEHRERWELREVGAPYKFAMDERRPSSVGSVPSSALSFTALQEEATLAPAPHVHTRRCLVSQVCLSQRSSKRKHTQRSKHVLNPCGEHGMGHLEPIIHRCRFSIEMEHFQTPDRLNSGFRV